MLFVHTRIMGKRGSLWPFLSSTIILGLACLQLLMSSYFLGIGRRKLSLAVGLLAIGLWRQTPYHRRKWYDGKV